MRRMDVNIAASDGFSSVLEACDERCGDETFGDIFCLPT